MKSKKNFKKKQVNYRKDNDEIRIRERKKQPKKFNKHNLYSMIEEDEEYVLPDYTDEED